MSVSVVVKPGFVQDNVQHSVEYTGELTIGAGASDVYPAGGIPILAALIAALFPTTNDTKPHYVELHSTLGTGYIYTYIKSTGCMMVLEVPPSASLTTAGPLQQLTSGANSLSEVSADVIAFLIKWRRNASG
jgi:hypothetical protein